MQTDLDVRAALLGEADRDADEEGEGDEDTPTSAPGSSLAARNPYALLGEDEC